ncbi:hypothetical protein [Pseudomonas aeruginosa]|uniref:hypothetical protein n=1 Tax=Pseudomonas aeruginosa TaxID=287 RepID=UPI000CFEE4F9|nr:hypothetical protein [Pseudomonas aeruginosa]NPS84002.1 hypothetical protein [Pseudomonas aeruginosa]
MSAETPRERPILFNDQMVRAILEGRKTVTRRVMKPQPTPRKSGGHHWPCNVHQSMLHVERELQNSEGCWCGLAEAACPYGQPGDRLWVREAWAQINVAQAPGETWVVYRECDNRTDYGGPWKPSIHMRRRDSRILLEITAVRVERLQDISDDQAIAEGIDTHPTGFYGNGCITAGGAFLELWESINGDGKWAANPWVWVIEFKRVAP